MYNSINKAAHVQDAVDPRVEAEDVGVNAVKAGPSAADSVTDDSDDRRRTVRIDRNQRAAGIALKMNSPIFLCLALY